MGPPRPPASAARTALRRGRHACFSPGHAAGSQPSMPDSIADTQEASCCAPRRSAPACSPAGWSSVAASPRSAFHGAEHRALAPPGLPATAPDRTPTTGSFADWLAPVLRRALAARPHALRARGTAPSGASTTTRCCSRPMRSPRWPATTDRAATTIARAPLARRLCDSPPVERARRLAGGRSPVPQPGLGREPRHARCGDGQVDRPEGRGGAHVRVAGARRAAAAAARPST